jgi:hypothetical protein
MTFRCVTGISYDKNPFNDSSAQWVSQRQIAEAQSVIEQWMKEDVAKDLEFSD